MSEDPTSNRKFGWLPDLPDHRDHIYKPPRHAVALPSSYSLADAAPFIFDQGQLGSCTANAVLTLVGMTQLEQQPANKLLGSRLALYYWTRVAQGTPNQDSGASIRGTMQQLSKVGICQEKTWPYVTNRFKQKPSAEARTEEAKHRLEGTEYARVNQTVEDLKATVYAKNAIAFGFTVFESFMSKQTARSGVMTMPQRNERQEGGHAVAMIGWDDAREAFVCKNSWGGNWGVNGGLFYMPYKFATSRNYASDFWTLNKVVPL